MTITRLVSVASLAFGAACSAAHAQAEWRQAVWPGYPGAFLVAPQQANFKAPALYRTVNDRNNLENPVGVVRICDRDMRSLVKNKTVTEPQPVVAAGVQNHSTRMLGGKIDIDAKVVTVNANAQYDQIVTLSTGSVQVYETEDDDIGRTILRHVGVGCRDVIVGHLKKRRVVFVAAKAIQAYDYEAVFERTTSAGAAGWCSWRWCPGVKVELQGRMTDKNRASAAKTFVTVALVPAEIGDRQSITMDDLTPPSTKTASADAFQFAQATADGRRSAHARTALDRNGWSDWYASAETPRKPRSSAATKSRHIAPRWQVRL